MVKMMGINFNEKTMRKAEFTSSIVMSDGGFGTVIDDGDCPGVDFVETRTGQEVWVFEQIEAKECANGSMLFVYIPEYDIATCILSQYIGGE